jgi:cell division cycle protein 37
MRAPGENGKKALSVFTTDVDATYGRMETRVREMNADTQSHLSPSGGGEEQIQLVAEGTNTISFNLPDGPPPAEIRFEGEGTEDWDVEEVRAFLQKKWDIFQAFDVKMQEALKSEDLEKVNKVLGKMGVEKAEAVVSGFFLLTSFPPSLFWALMAAESVD